MTEQIAYTISYEEKKIEGRGRDGDATIPLKDTPATMT
jgi:hypothetical protein